jgi:hypothetical protein
MTCAVADTSEREVSKGIMGGQDGDSEMAVEGCGRSTWKF